MTMNRDIIGAVLVGASVVLLYLIYPSLLADISDRDRSLSAYSDDWNDVSEFRIALEERGFTTRGIVATPGILREVREPERTLMIIIGVGTPYSYDDIRSIVDFVDKGGSLILADDYGYGDDLSNEFGITFHRYRMWDPNYVTNTSLLDIDLVLPDINGTSRTYEVLFNDPTAIESNQQGTTLGFTSNESFLDVNANGAIDVQDQPGPFEVVTLKGRTVFIGDPSIFINDMWAQLDNSDFLLALVDFLLPEGGTVLFDESVHAAADFSEGFYRTLTSTFVFVFGDLTKGLFVTSMIALMMVVMSQVVGDPKLWHHRLAIREIVVGNLQFLETNFKGRRKELADRLRNDSLDLICVRSGMRANEFASLPDRRLRTLLNDEKLFRFLKGRDMDPNEVFERLDRWM